MRLILILGLGIALCGCADSEPVAPNKTTLPKGQKMPPEVLMDPASAAKLKTKHRR